ncbi:MAG TPA: MATE family efflux transporter [Gemmatimonadaceae bacterium]
MQDLTSGSIAAHIGRLAAPIAAGMVFQTLYYLVDLYFVARLGGTAIAGVSAAGNVAFIVMALTQVLGVGTMVLISHAAGRKDRQDANLIYNQSLLMAAVCGMLTLIGGFGLSRWYLGTITADAATLEAGMTYLYWFIPGMALQFALISMGSALRGTGIAKPTMVVQMLTVLINAALAPVLIAGIGTGRPMGVAGAGLATSIAVVVGVFLMFVYFERLEKFVGFDATMFRPRPEVWRRVLKIGLPAGGEFALMFLYMAVVYYSIRAFGPEAQAGFGVGGRVMQAVFLPAMAVAFAAAPVAGQNFGAGLHDRTRKTFTTAAVLGTSIMLMLTVVIQLEAEWMVGFFTRDAAVVSVASTFLHIISFNFVATGVIFTCSSMFQALGNTIPSVVSSATRLVTFAVPAIYLSSRPGFQIRHIWFLSVATVALQLVISLVLVRREFRRRLAPPPAGLAPSPASA